MFENGIKQQWASGKPILNSWLSIPNAFTAEIMAAQGYDTIGIDMQHGLMDYQVLVGMLQATRYSRAPALVRVPWLDPAIIMKVLDAGANGVICPMIDTAEQAAQFVSYLRYPPHGNRSYGPGRAVFSVGSDYGQFADDEVVGFAMIETREGFDNLEAIAKVDGLDAIYIGPADLTLALTGKKYRIGFDREEPEMVQAIQHILEICHAAGKRVGLHCGTPAYAAKAIFWGFDLVTLTNDVRLLAGAAAADVRKTRELLNQNVASTDAQKPSY